MRENEILDDDRARIFGVQHDAVEKIVEADTALFKKVRAELVDGALRWQRRERGLGGERKRGQQSSAKLFEFRVPFPNRHAPSIKRLDPAIPNDIGPDPRGMAADDNVVADGHGFGPQRTRALGMRLGVVLEADRWSFVDRGLCHL